MSGFAEIAKNLAECNRPIVRELVQIALDQGIPAKEILDEGLMGGMRIVGEMMEAVMKANRPLLVMWMVLGPLGLSTVWAQEDGEVTEGEEQALKERLKPIFKDEDNG